MMGDIRTPPLPAMMRRRHPLGQCRWCGEPIFKNGNPCEFATRRNWHDGRLGEPDCLHEFKLLTDPAALRRAVYWRDRGRCYICGFVHVAVPQMIWVDEFGDRSESGFPQTHIGWFPPSGGWECEHKVPLWKVAGMPDDQRRWYFSMENCAVACTTPCHRDKSIEEHVERAKLKRLEQQRAGKPKSKGARRLDARRRWEEMP